MGKGLIENLYLHDTYKKLVVQIYRYKFKFQTIKRLPSKLHASYAQIVINILSL